MDSSKYWWFTRAVTDGRAGIFIIHPSGKREEHHVATGKHCSNYKAETEAPMKAVSLIEDSTEDIVSVMFLTDARSVLVALTDNEAPKLAKGMQQLSTTYNVAQECVAMWPSGTTLHEKLYGDVEDNLIRTTTFIVETGVIV